MMSVCRGPFALGILYKKKYVANLAFYSTPLLFAGGPIAAQIECWLGIGISVKCFACGPIEGPTLYTDFDSTKWKAWPEE